MITYSTVYFHPLSKLVREEYVPLVPKEFAFLLRGENPEAVGEYKVFGIEARDGPTCIGLLLATFVPFIRLVEIHSLFVQKTSRHMGVGTHLFELLENEAKLLKAQTITFKYPEEEDSTPFFKQILASRYWIHSQPFLLRPFFNATLFNAPWYANRTPFSEGFEVLPWENLDDESKRQLHEMVSQGVVPSIVTPFREQEKIEPINTLILRLQGNIIGWLITHRLDDDLIRYSSLFIHKDFRNNALSQKLLAAAIEKQQKSPVPYAIFELPLLQVPKYWVQFVHTYLIPYADHVTKITQSWKDVPAVWYNTK